jgi:hypothetical protein
MCHPFSLQPYYSKRSYRRRLFSRLQIEINRKLHITDRAAERGQGGGNCPGPTLIGPQLQSESLKLSRFFKLVRAFFEIEGPLQYLHMRSSQGLVGSNLKIMMSWGPQGRFAPGRANSLGGPDYRN